MSELINNYGDGTLVRNVRIYDLEESIRAAKYPKAVKIDEDTPTSALTEGIAALATTDIGEGHDNWLTGVRIAFDLTATIKMWTEAERYHFFDIVSSQSTMHKITKFDLDKAYCDFVDPRMVPIMKELVAEYNKDPAPEKYLKVLYSNPVGMKLTARITTNYRQLKTIWVQRRFHRLPEWQDFCNWIEILPHSELIVGSEEATA